MTKLEKEERPNYFIYFVAFAIQIIIFSVGTAWTWTSPFLPQFESNDTSINPVGRPITTIEAGLMVSIINLGLLIGPVVPLLLTEKVGKKTTILLSASPFVASHVMCVFATTIEVFLVARFLMGLSSGAVWSTIPVYLGEISEPKNRGVLACFISIMSSTGGLFGYCVGPFLSMKWFSIVNLAPIIIFYILVFFFLPESPFDLIIKSKFKQAEDSLIQLRKRKDVQTELLQIKKYIEADTQENAKLIDLFRDFATFKVLLLGIGVLFLNGWSGICVVLGYTQTIFQLAGSSIPPEYCSIIVSCIGVFSTMIHIKLVDKLGRKILLTTACTLVFLALSGLGLFFFLKQINFNVKSLEWLPLCSVILYMSGFYFGLASVPYLIVGEIFPSNIKTVASTFCMAAGFTLTFLVTLVFPYLFETITIAGTFWLFALLNGLSIVFCLTLLPETKGKSLQEITAMLNKSG